MAKVGVFVCKAKVSWWLAPTQSHKNEKGQVNKESYAYIDGMEESVVASLNVEQWLNHRRFHLCRKIL